LTRQPPNATLLTVNKEVALSDEPTLAGMIPLSQLADFLQEHLTVDVEVFEEPYSDGYVKTRVTVMLGDTTIARGSDSYRYRS
jgi:hypothetical protein